jgi:hypothetical protein
MRVEVCAETLEESRPAKLLDDLNEYDHIILAMSGGKDCMKCLFNLDNMGVDMGKVELWHQSVDGGETFLDWPTIESYIEAVGDYFGISVHYQWRDGGFKGELLRKDSLKGDIYYLHGGEKIAIPTTRGRTDGRQKFPALSPDLRFRWCSADLKIDVAKRVINNEPRFKGTKDQQVKILYISGERREESLARSKYDEIRLHETHTKSRTVHHWRMVIDESETQIWDEYERRRFLPATPYLLGWNRTSCFGCIFSTPDLWAMTREIAPERFTEIARMERELGHTIDPRMDVTTKANLGKIDRLPKGSRLQELIRMGTDPDFRFTKEDLILERWELPAGAFHGAAGGSL